MTYSVLKVPLNPNQPTSLSDGWVATTSGVMTLWLDGKCVLLLLFLFFVLHICHVKMCIYICGRR